MIKFLISLFFFINYIFCSEVLELKSDNFDMMIVEHPITMIEFYSLRYRYCKELAPKYEVAAKLLKAADHLLALAKVDCVTELHLCEKYNIRGLPTIIIFKNGKFFDHYGDEHTSDAIVKYMLTKIPNIKTGVIYGYFKNEESDLYLTFQSVANNLNGDFKFAYTFRKEVAVKFGIEEGVYIIYPKVVTTKFENALNKYNGENSENELKTWIEKNIMGIAGLRTSLTSKFFKEYPLLIAYYIFDYEMDPKGSNYWRNRILKVATKFINSIKNIHFAISNLSELNKELEDFGINNPDNSSIYITIRTEENKKYIMTKNFSIENLEEFISNFLEAKLIAYVKSENIPELNDEPIKVVVAKNFEEIVNDPTKDVIIEFYSPLCSLCKTFAPIYEELAKKLVSEPNIVIAKMDVTANDVPSIYNFSRLPGLFFVPKNDKLSPKFYSGKKEMDAFIKFIAEESSSSEAYENKEHVVKSDL